MAKAVHVTYGNQRRSIVIHTRMTLNELLSLLHATFSIPKSNPDMIQGLRYRDQDTIVPLDYVIRLAEQMPSEMDLVVSTPTSTSTSTSTSTTTSRLRPYSRPSTASSSQPSSATSTTSFGNGITAVRSATNKNKHIKLSNGDDFSAPRPSSKIDALASTIASLDPASRASLLSKLGVPSENTRINTARTVSSTDHLLPRRRTRTPSLGDDDTGTRSTPHKKIRKSTSFSNDINTPFFYSEATRFTLPTVHSGRRSSMSRYRSPAWSGAIQQPSTSTSTSTPSSQQLFTAGSNGYYQPQPIPTPTINGPFGASQRNLRRTTSQSSSTSRAPPSLIHAPSIDPDNHRGTVLLRSYTELLEQLASAEERMVVLAIYARGSKPCREISSVFDRMAASGHFPDLIFAEIDAEYLKYTALQVEAVPTFHFYIAEHILAQLVGPSADELEKVIVSSEALVHAQLASSAARAQYDSDSDTSAMGTKGPTIYDESDVENEYEIRPRSDSLASSVTPSELDTWGDLKSDSDISEYDTEDDYQYTQQRKLKKLLKQRARLQRHVQQIQQIEESLEEPEDDDEWMSSRQAQHYRTLPGDESDMDETRSRRDSILDDTEIDENYFAPPSPSRPLITSDEAAIIEKLILRQDPRVDLAYRAVPELSKVIDAFMRLAQSVRNSPTHASTSTSTSAVKSAPASTRHRNDSMPSDVERWYEKEHEIQPTTSSYHEKNCTVLNDILVQLYNDGEISRSHIVLLHALGQQSDGSIHDALLQYHIDGDKMILIRKLKDVACNTDPNKINFNLGHDVEKATPRRDVATSTTTRAQDASTSTHRNVATTTKTRGRDQSTSTSTPTTTRGTSTIRPRQVNAQTSTSSRITRATNTTPGSKTKSTSTSPTKIPTVPDSPLDAVSQHKLSELRDHLSRLESFLRRDLITKDEALQLARWMQEGQPLIQAALMAYTFNQDEMDLLDSFLRILRKKHIMSQQTTPASNTKSHIRRFSSQPFDESIDVDESDEADEMTNELIWSSALSSMDLLMRFVRAVPMEITKEQRETLAKMVSSQDPVILAAFELYKETDKMDEFVDTLYRLVKQEKKSTTTSAKTTSPKKTTSSTTTSSTDKSSSTTAQDNMKNHDEVKQELQIMGVLERGNVFDADQAAYLRQLILSRDDCIMAAFDLAKQDEQWDEMHDTLSRLIARRRPDLGIEMNTARTHTSQPDIDENDEDDDDEKDASFNINRFQKLFANVVEAMTDATTLTHQQAIWLCKAFVARHPLIQAALEVYSLDEDVEELQDSLRVIAVENVKAQTQPSQPQQQNGDEDEDEEEEEDQDDDDDDDDDEDEEDQEEDQDDEETTLSHHGLGNSYGTLHDVDEDDDDDDEDVDGLANGIRAVDWGDQPYEEINGGDEE